MRGQFRTYCGEAGDLQEMLICEVKHDGKILNRIDRLIPRVGPGWYRLWRMRRAKRSILNELEILTGERHYETI